MSDPSSLIRMRRGVHHCLRVVGIVSAMAVFASALESAPVRVATFNVLNYLPMDRRVEGRFRPTYPKPEVEKAAVRAVIREVAPDVLALQEMGPTPYLEELRQDLAREGLHYAHSYLLEAADPERHVAVLSRLPFVRVTPHAEVGFKYFGAPEQVKRGLLEVTFASDAGEWTLFVLHLKSRFTDRADDPMSQTRRTAEATAVRDLVLTRFPDPTTARFAFVGDCNDTRDSAPLARLLHRGRTTITRIVPTADSRGETWTHRYAPADSYTRVDYILVSPGLWPHLIDGAGRIHDGDGALSGSDHRLVYVDLDFENGNSAPSLTKDESNAAAEDESG